MNEERKRKGGEEIHILCIEDSDDDYEIIKRSLEKNITKPLLIERVSTWREGINRIRNTAFDVLLLDYLLPDMNGLEILERIKKENVEIPIIMLTGGGDENIAVKAMKEGVSDYLVKDDLGTTKLGESVTQVIALTRFLKQWDTGFPELHGLGKKRDTLTIIASTLSASVNGISKTRLVYKTNLNFTSIKKYLVFLLANGFLSVHTNDRREMYKTTEKGLLLLKQLRDIKEYFG